MKKIAFLGLGAMGGRMAQRLTDQGYDLTVYNRSPQAAQIWKDKKIKVAATPREAVKDVEVVISMLKDDSASHDVWLDADKGAIHGLRRNTLVVESSTLSFQWAHKLALEFRSRGILYFEAPVVGSLPQVEAGQLTVLLAGPHENHSFILDILKCYSEKTYFLDGYGKPAAAKLAINAYFVWQVEALANVFSIFQKSQIPKEKMFEILRSLPVMSPSLVGILNLVGEGKHDPRFPVHLVEKDMKYVEKMMIEFQISPDFLRPLLVHLQKAISNGQGLKNLSILVDQA